ncbi:MAG: hypothetical protein JKX94_05000 [Sneathiella sp.]|nr:hypothetical protein [Sneathiella sp.]
MFRLLSVVGLSVITFVFLGNAMKSFITSTVFVSEGVFASFLNISVDKTQILVELLIGSSVMALAIAPFVLSRERAQRIATLSAVTAAACYAALGLTLIWGPPLFYRELMVILTFAVGGFCISFFAPIAQLAITEVKTEKERALLTTVWTSAQPVAFLITPQLVKYVAHDIGTGNYFLIFSALPIVYLLLTKTVLKSFANGSDQDARNQTAPPPDWRVLGMLLLAMLTFEFWTLSNSLAGVISPVSLSMMVLFFVVAIFTGLKLKRQKRDQGASGKALAPTATLLLVALFILEIPSTGFYDTAYLVRHLCSSTLIEDRASLGAAAQIAAVALGGFLYLRWPSLMPLLLLSGILLLLGGSVGYVYYPDMAIDVDFFYISKMVASAGMGLITTVIVTVVMSECRENPVLILLPALIIMFGTEFGLEILEIVYQGSKLLGLDEIAAYRTIFIAQVVAILIAVLPCAEAMLLHVKGNKRTPELAS